MMNDKKPRPWMHVVFEIAALNTAKISGMLEGRNDLPETFERLKQELKEVLNNE